MTNSQGERVRSVRFAHDITKGYAHTFHAATAANVHHSISFRFPWKFYLFPPPYRELFSSVSHTKIVDGVSN